ncbi:MAG: hypothetical protein JXM70_11955 [Pirellulales bacterium]|nr:hypothetical protein [Pirellulales bacterium]
MKRLNLILVFVIFLLSASAVHADQRYEIAFPDLPSYKTLKCDFHMHTVFSDGQVWPTVRVDEAARQGLDAIAISDHIEYQPHKDDVSTNHNRPYELAVHRARMLDVLLIKAGEITRDTPPGHFNAIFLSDVNPLDTEDFVEVFKRAAKQGAFVFWNHQGWKGEEKGSWRDVHTTLYDGKLFQGMEVCNENRYFPTAHKWCLEKNLTMMGDSDIHTPDLRTKSLPEDHRTLTLVFAKKRTIPAIKEALQAGRTAAWFKQQLIGRKEFLAPLFDKCVTVECPHLRTKDAVFTKIRNDCDLDIVLKRTAGPGPVQIDLPARSVSLLKVDTKTPDEPLELKYSAINFIIAPGKCLDVMLKVPGK